MAPTPSPALSSLALLTIVVGCGPSAREVKTEAPLGTSPTPPPPRVTRDDELLVLGRMCPDMAQGGPAIMGVAVRADGWSADDRRMRELFATRTTRQFSVMAWNGARAGLFSVAGAAQSRALGPAPLAIGSYTGAPPCADDDGELIPACVQVTGGCGVAIAAAEPASGIEARPLFEDPEPVVLDPREVCREVGRLRVDVDGDGVLESFAIPAATLPSELVASGSSDEPCRDGAGAGPAQLVLASDLDRDGRAELVLSLRRGNTETWALYRAGQTPVRLDRVMERRVR